MSRLFNPARSIPLLFGSLFVVACGSKSTGSKQDECRTQVNLEVKAIGEQIGAMLMMGQNPQTDFPNAPFHPAERASGPDPRPFTAINDKNGNPWVHYDQKIIAPIPRSTPGVFAIQRDDTRSQLSVIGKTDCDSNNVEEINQFVLSLPHGEKLSHGWITPP